MQIDTRDHIRPECLCVKDLDNSVKRQPVGLERITTTLMSDMG